MSVGHALSKPTFQHLILMIQHYTVYLYPLHCCPTPAEACHIVNHYPDVSDEEVDNYVQSLLTGRSKCLISKPIYR